jgi:hypothetical protein
MKPERVGKEDAEKRQRTGAVQDASRLPGRWTWAPAFGLRQSSGAFPLSHLTIVSFALLLAALVVLVLFIVLGPRHSATKPGAGPIEVPRANLELRDSRLYRVGETIPFSGLMVDFYESGALKSRSAVTNGLLQGLSQGWHTNGQLQVTEHFQEGVSHGVRAKWYESGARKSEGLIVEGQFHGTWRRWHENGALAEQIESDHGNPHGTSLAYYPSGQIKARATFQNGKMVEQKFWKDQNPSEPPLATVAGR